MLLCSRGEGCYLSESVRPPPPPLPTTDPCVSPSVGQPGRLTGQLLGDEGMKKGRLQEAHSFPFYSIYFHRKCLSAAALCCQEGGSGMGGAQGSRTRSALEELRWPRTRWARLLVLPQAAAAEGWKVSDARPGLSTGPASLCRHLPWARRAGPTPRPVSCPLRHLSCWGLSVAPQAEAVFPPQASGIVGGSALLPFLQHGRPSPPGTHRSTEACNFQGLSHRWLARRVSMPPAQGTEVSYPGLCPEVRCPGTDFQEALPVNKS